MPEGRRTTRSALVRFLQRLTCAAQGQPLALTARTPRRRERDLAGSMDRLARMGI
jgi:hypothetical protein